MDGFPDEVFGGENLRSAVLEWVEVLKMIGLNVNGIYCRLVNAFPILNVCPVKAICCGKYDKKLDRRIDKMQGGHSKNLDNMYVMSDNLRYVVIRMIVFTIN